MYKLVLKFIVCLLLLANALDSFATIRYSNGTGGGAWGAAGTWIPSGVPACGDTLYIVAGDIVSIINDQDYSAPGCGAPMFIIVDSLGSISFPTNGKRLKLPCNSGLILEPGGNLIAPGTGGGNSTFLEICGVEVWRKRDGPKTGPLTYGDPLPIELLSFEANLKDEKVDLKWVTATEINNNYFTIERTTDGSLWEVVLTTSGAGNSNQIIEYYEVDYEPILGMSYYRLKQTDFDGKFSYSNVIPVKYEKNSGNGTINLFPSPVKPGETITLEFNNIFEDDLLVVLRDIQGKEFYSKVVVNIEDGKLIGVPIDISIPAGIYLVTASSENRMYSQKLIIK